MSVYKNSGGPVHDHRATAQRTISALLAVQATSLRDRPAIGDAAGQTIDYAELHRRVNELAAALRQCGIRRDSRVAIVMPNGFPIALALLAVSCAAIAVPLNPVYQAEELENYFREAHISEVLVLEDRAPAARAVAEKFQLPVITMSAGGERLTSSSARSPAVPPEAPAPDDVALILLTSGSTGRPKKVPLTHRNLCAGAANVSQSLNLTEQDICLSMWEQHHIGGLVDLLLAPLISGGYVICAGSFDAGRFYTLLSSAKPSWFQGVPTTLRELLHLGKARHEPAKASSLRFLRSVAAALPPPQMAELETFFGVPVIQTFGMTEAAPLITTNRLPPGLRKPGSVGSPCGPEVAVMDNAGRPLPAGQHGEVAVRGENVFAGYEADAEANAQTRRYGWFYTGDIGYFDDDGYLFLLGRVKELINRGGEKISPYEVEAVLTQHPAVSEAVVFAQPHRSLGEDVGAALVLRTGHTLTETQARAWVAERLSSFKIPRTILFLDRLPRCPVGKVRRQDISLLAQQANKRAVPVAAATPLEAFLARLWARELDLPEVGVEDDFTMIGGDSLSSIRLLAATEAFLGIELPVELLAEFTTVRRMANHLAGMGVVTSGQSDADIDAMLLRVSTQPAAAASDSAAATQSAALSDSESKSFQEALLNVLTPQELLSGAHGDDAFLATLREETARHPDTLRWARQPVGPHAHWYTTGPGNKSLIVGFPGRALRLMMPLYRFLMNIDAQQFDVLLLQTADRGYYESGIPGYGNDLASLADWLDSWSTQQGYRQRISFGTSAGGLPALYVGIAKNWQRAVAVGADLLSLHPLSKAALLKARAATPEACTTKVIQVYGQSNERDRFAAKEFMEIFPYTLCLAVAQTDWHNSLEVLFRRGKLKQSLNSLLAG